VLLPEEPAAEGTELVQILAEHQEDPSAAEELLKQEALLDLPVCVPYDRQVVAGLPAGELQEEGPLEDQEEEHIPEDPSAVPEELVAAETAVAADQEAAEVLRIPEDLEAAVVLDRQDAAAEEPVAAAHSQVQELHPSLAAVAVYIHSCRLLLLVAVELRGLPESWQPVFG
jgi:hypothetical protein